MLNLKYQLQNGLIKEDIMNEEIQGGEYSVKDTGELIVLLGSVFMAVDGAMADGKIGLEDLGQAMLIVPHIGPAIDGVGNIPSELDELDDEDKAALQAKVDAAFGEGAFQKVGKPLFTAAVNVVAAYNKMKEIKL